jgi:post-segregation antitoxin (ccd killing protein)
MTERSTAGEADISSLNSKIFRLSIRRRKIKKELFCFRSTYRLEGSNIEISALLHTAAAREQADSRTTRHQQTTSGIEAGGAVCTDSATTFAAEDFRSSGRTAAALLFQKAVATIRRA